MTEPKKPAAPAAAPAKPTFPALLEALRTSDLNFSTAGSALCLAHVLVELGDAKVERMTAKDVVAHARNLVRQVPWAWPAFRMGNTLQLVRALDAYKVAHETAEHYQAEIARLTPSQIGAAQAEFNKATLDRLQGQLKAGSAG